MAKKWSSESATNRLLMIIALFVAILAFSSVFVVESLSRATILQKNMFSGYSLAFQGGPALAPMPSFYSPSVSSTPSAFPSSSSSPGKPDLISRFPDAVNGTISGRVGTNLTIRENTKNIGAAYANPSRTRVVAGNSTFVFNKPGLGVGMSKTNTFSFTCVRAGNFPASTMADFDFRISESNEANNGESITIKCR